MNKIRLAIAEDHERFRGSIIRFLHTHSDLVLVLQVTNGKELLEQLSTTLPDIILMNIRMPLMDGIEAAEKVSRLYPQVKIIAFSQYDFEDNIVKMYVHGVKSFIGKDDDHEELVKAIRIVHSGGTYMTDRSAGLFSDTCLT